MNKIACFLILAFLGGCDENILKKENINSSIVTDSIQIIQQDVLYSLPFNDKKVIIASDSAEFVSISDSIGFEYSIDSIVESIDFNTEMILFAFMGQQPSSGFTIGFDINYSISDSIYIGILRTQPHDTCSVDDVITFPYAIGKIIKSEKEISVSEKIIFSCSN